MPRGVSWHVRYEAVPREVIAQSQRALLEGFRGTTEGAEGAPLKMTERLRGNTERVMV